MQNLIARTKHLNLSTVRLIAGSLICFFSFFFFMPASAETVETATLTIKIVGIESDDGQINIAVFGAEDAWMKMRLYEIALDIEERSCTWVIEEVPFGEYGVAVYHDENGNGKHDKNFLGIPTEPYGFSNNVRGKMKTPGWKETKFSISDPVLEIEIEVK